MLLYALQSFKLTIKRSKTFVLLCSQVNSQISKLFFQVKNTFKTTLSLQFLITQMLFPTALHYTFINSWNTTISFFSHN